MDIGKNGIQRRFTCLFDEDLLRKINEYDYRHESYSRAVLLDRNDVAVLRKM